MQARGLRCSLSRLQGRHCVACVTHARRDGAGRSAPTRSPRSAGPVTASLGAGVPDEGLPREDERGSGRAGTLAGGVPGRLQRSRRPRGEEEFAQQVEEPAQQPPQQQWKSRQTQREEVQEKLQQLAEAQVQPESGNGAHTSRVRSGVGAAERIAGGRKASQTSGKSRRVTVQFQLQPPPPQEQQQPQPHQQQQQEEGLDDQQQQQQQETAAREKPAGRQRVPLFGPTSGGGVLAPAATHSEADVGAAMPAGGAAAAPSPASAQQRRRPQANKPADAPMGPGLPAAASAPTPASRRVASGPARALMGAPPPAPEAGTMATRPSAAGPSATAPPATTTPAAAAPVSGPPVHVLWDLDNKYPVVLDHRRVVANIRSALQPYGRVVAIRAYCNHHTLNHVPELWQEAVELGMEHPLKPANPGPIRCPLCGNTFREAAKLERHFRDLHGREQRKRMHNDKAARRHKETDKHARRGQGTRTGRPGRSGRGGARRAKGRAHALFMEASRQVLRRPKGFDLAAILAKEGVVVTPVDMGPQMADVALEKDASALLRRQVVPHAPPPVLCLISDDHGFEPLLQLAANRGWDTVVVANTSFQNAGAQMEWSRVVGL
ncbi:hypothetical protein TSOC_010513 [Tetrabaena socialis]|uniref:C2H2-type domain-containing protein n=1 Tax=Tetrabaena socialis TaxID=47790 RepID=A0A2J7ZT32_9CHLO|nr:hypothetical protein TSOC_010513 [Tetrabaena socialis]|eukprot:PNH03427.1 hypothetical protein TSOC_010513 [Tetrabaena socialis]